MPTTVYFDPAGGPLRTKVRIRRPHFGSSRIQLFSDPGGDGLPEIFERMLKVSSADEDHFIEVGPPGELPKNAAVQWDWLVVRPSGAKAKWMVEVHLEQDGDKLPDTPIEVTGELGDEEKEVHWAGFLYLKPREGGSE